MGALQSAPRHPHPGGPNPTSLSQRTLCRHKSKVGTVCVNRASTGLCGGYRATDIPTATSPDPRRALEIGIGNLRVHRLRYLAQGASPRDSGQRWLTFLKQHANLSSPRVSKMASLLGKFRRLGCLTHGDFPTIILLGGTLAAMGVFGNKAMSQFPKLPFALLLLKP